MGIVYKPDIPVLVLANAVPYVSITTMWLVGAPSETGAVLHYRNDWSCDIDLWDAFNLPLGSLGSPTS